jgi:outer membrane protein assembly factor BamB
VSPDPVGAGQEVFVVMWLDKVPVSAAGVGGDRWENYRVLVTRPDGTTQTLGPFLSDATSAYATLYTPDQVGTYNFEFTFPGQIASLYHPETGIPGSNSQYIGDYFTPSSATTSIIVQEDPITETPIYPLPSKYWTRPVESQNTQWSSIVSNYMRGSQIIDRVQPTGIAPNSPHIMWTKPLQDGGIVGGDFSIEGAAYYPGLSYEGRFSNPLIIGGRLYYDTPLSNDPNDGPYTCVDLATGEVLWENPDIAPTFGSLYLYESFNQHGVIGDGYLWQSAGSYFSPVQEWDAYDPRTGEWLFTLTDVPSGYGGGFFGGYGSGVYGPNGELIVYNLDNFAGRLTAWTSAAGPDSPLVATPGTGSNAYQYRPIGKVANTSIGHTLLNVSVSGVPAGASILRAIPGDMMLVGTSLSAGFFGFGNIDYTLAAISLKSGQEGQMLWTKNFAAPTGNLTKSIGTIDPETRVFTKTIKETMQWEGYDLDTGNKIWGPVGDFRDFQYYGTVSHPPAPGNAYNGNLYVGGYGGELHCFDQLTGTLLWKYDDTDSGENTPWGKYPLYIGAIADEKVYCFTGEHSPNTPMYKGSQIRCIDANTGDELWTLDGWYADGSFGEESMPVADGKIVYLNGYDMQIYCVGKGPSALTVDAPGVAIVEGESMMITGTVTDQSPGAVGTPAVSDAVMGDWMEYLYMQKPMPMDATGVEVVLEVFDPNGNFYEIGTTTSDTEGNYGLMWTPDVPGEYMVLASFLGSESYWGSHDSTYVGVVDAPEPTPEPEATPAPMTDTYVLGMGAAALIAIVVIGLVLIMMMRKK